MRQYVPTESEKIHEKHLKILIKAMVGLAPIYNSFQEFEVSESVRVDKKRMDTVPKLNVKP